MTTKYRFSKGMAAGALLAPLPLAMLVLSTIPSAGCFDRSCEDTFVERPAGSGTMLDSNTWESNPIDAEWLDYGPRRTIFFRWPEFGGRRPDLFLPYISSSPTPLSPTDGDTFTLAGGDLATFTNVTSDGIFVRNNTCAQYYLRLVAVARADAGADGGAASTDGGASADAADTSVQDANVQDADSGADASDAGL